MPRRLLRDGRVMVDEWHYLTETAIDLVEKKDLAGVEKFLDPLYAQRSLADWAKNQFGVEVTLSLIHI